MQLLRWMDLGEVGPSCGLQLGADRAPGQGVGFVAVVPDRGHRFGQRLKKRFNGQLHNLVEHTLLPLRSRRQKTADHRAELGQNHGACYQGGKNAATPVLSRSTLVRK